MRPPSFTRSSVALAAVVTAVCGGAQTAGGDAGPRRFALIAGNDRGGGDTRPLLYAKDDARKVWETLTRLGSVRAEDATLLLDGDAPRFLGALGELERRAHEARARGEKTALIVYYSGHAKDGALRLGDSQIPLGSLKARLGQAPFDVRIGIFDSCQSGALTRTKGARRAPAFEVDTRGARETRGTVILTSSAADEDSQESDQIGGSYFSHHLTSGLLGGADKSGDGRVTLSEAYAYAYDRTVADTADSTAGAQHPTFSYDLAGNGDLILTDIVTRREGLLLPVSAPMGTYYLVDGKGYISAEIVKGPSERRVALSPGRYRVKRRLPDRLRVGEIEIPRGQLVALVEPLLRDAPFSDDPVKGGGRDPDGTAHWRVGVGAGYQNVFAAPSEGLFPASGLVNLDFALRDFFRRDWLWGFDGTLGGTRSEVVLPTAVLAYRFSQVSLATSVMAEPRGWRWGPLSPFVGARVALLLMTRRFDDRVLPDQFFATLSPGLVAGARLRLGDSLALVARGRVHYLLYNVDEANRSLGYWEAAAFMQYDFGGSR
jgi:hypothetical protein